MRRLKFLAPSVLALLVPTQGVQAQTGTITFNGIVSSVTCDISFNGATGADPVVALQTVNARSLLHGMSAGRKDVHVRLSGTDPVCYSPATVLSLNTRRAAGLRNGRLLNRSFGLPGTNAVLALRDANDDPIDLTDGWVLPNDGLRDGAVDFRFSAEYFADEGDAVPGPYQAYLEYTVVYP